MTVYVDQAIFEWRGKMWAHLFADTLEELHGFAAQLGLARAWFQGPPVSSWDHYDVTEAVRKRAIKLGAVETDRYGPVEFLAKQRGDTAKLRAIEVIRERKRNGEGEGKQLDLFSSV